MRPRAARVSDLPAVVAPQPRNGWVTWKAMLLTIASTIGVCSTIVYVGKTETEAKIQLLQDGQRRQWDALDRERERHENARAEMARELGRLSGYLEGIKEGRFP